ncbi:hypothetical protein RJ639_007065 [Escallonia herrerae]|uniref:Reverse transcriptase RNase H-like domain-containing protein n=1 Tax=Escallonia herrerae TaxID=1293975 RepID=A0AA88VYU9_9ASTE|nr:hypothetical protein RJ639_007065 [Escallonia herrerae]
MSDLLDRVEKYLRAEEDSMMSHQEEIHSGQKRRDRPEGKNQDEPKRPRALLSKSFTPLNTTHEHILHQIKGQNIIKWPKPMRGPAERRDTQMGISDDRVKPISSPLYGFTVAESVVSAVLIREQDGWQFPIYYVSKVLQGAEQRYPNAKKLAFALLIAARKLRLYFQSHTIIVLTDKPLRRILHKPNLSGRLVPWSIELGEFDIHYRP